MFLLYHIIFLHSLTFHFFFCFNHRLIIFSFLLSLFLRTLIIGFCFFFFPKPLLSFLPFSYHSFALATSSYLLFSLLLSLLHSHSLSLSLSYTFYFLPLSYILLSSLYYSHFYCVLLIYIIFYFLTSPSFSLLWASHTCYRIFSYFLSFIAIIFSHLLSSLLFSSHFCFCSPFSLLFFSFHLILSFSSKPFFLSLLFVIFLTIYHFLLTHFSSLFSPHPVPSHSFISSIHLLFSILFSPLPFFLFSSLFSPLPQPSHLLASSSNPPFFSLLFSPLSLSFCYLLLLNSFSSLFSPLPFPPNSFISF